MFQIQIDKMFAAAHALRLPDGQLEPLHGHNWPCKVVVESRQLDQMDTVMDFHKLEDALDRLLSRLHNQNINDVKPFAGENGMLAINTSAERIAQWIGQSMQKTLPDHVQLVRVELGEAPGCKAVWIP